MKKLLLKGGTVVSARGLKRVDVLISGEKIVAVGRRLNTDASVLDVSGRLIFPGFVDGATYFDDDSAGVATADDFDAGSKCALAGGVTTVVDFAVQRQGETLTDTLNDRHMKAFANASCDYAFHMALNDWNDETKRELTAMPEQGVTTFGVSSSTLSDRAVYEMMTALRACGGAALCYGESGGLSAKLSEEAVARGETSLPHYAATCPDYAEAAAVHRCLALAQAADVPCVAAVSSAATYDETERARRRGARVYTATCPQYLLLDESVYHRPLAQSAGFVCNPPLRTDTDRQVLWQALKSGAISTVFSAHRAFTPEQKQAGEGDFTKIPAGIPGADVRALLLYTYGVKKRRLTLEQLCAVLSENPARLFGIYPKKGVIKAGADADLVIFNPKGESRITAAASLSKCGYSPYEGIRTVGKIEKVYLRGSLAYSGGSVVLEHSGRYLSRKGCALKTETE